MKYKYRMPILMCRHNNRISYLGNYDYSPILDKKEEYIGKTFDLLVVKNKDEGRIKIEVKSVDNEDNVEATIENYVKIGEFTITDIKYVSNTVLMVEGVVDSEYRIGEDELERYVLRLGGLVGLTNGKYEFFKIMFFYVADVIGDYKKLMSIGTNVPTNEVNNYEFVDIETLVKIKNKREGDIPTL